MLKIHYSANCGLTEVNIHDAKPGAWFNLTKPDASEIRDVAERTGAPLDFLHAALDREEPSRVEAGGGYILIIMNVPKTDDGVPFGYDTLPLGVVISPDYIITVCLEENEALDDFDAPRQLFFDTGKRIRMALQMLYKCASMFLKDLSVMNRRTDDIEQDLRRSMKNKELFLLLDMQKTLTYFTVALRSNKNALERLTRMLANQPADSGVKLCEEDNELLEDVRVEFSQAIEMSQMHGEVLASMMDAFASVISNNLNIVMKFLTSVTIVLSIPTMIASFFGMNVPVPWQGSVAGFIYAMMVAVALTVTVAVMLWRKRLF